MLRITEPTGVLVTPGSHSECCIVGARFDLVAVRGEILLGFLELNVCKTGEVFAK